MTKEQRLAIIISVSSDIGMGLAKRYSKDGYAIVGTYRSTNKLNELKGIPGIHLVHCDIDNKSDISKFAREYKDLGQEWDVLVSCPGSPLPLKAFFECDFDEWRRSIHTNAIEQLRVLHALYPFRNTTCTSSVVFFAGGGVNNAVINFSAYTISKIMLIKMCEYLDAENPDLNIFIIGPGWTKTKTHDLILTHVDRTDRRYQETIDFLQDGKGTSIDDIYDCIAWLCEQGKEIAGGRNFSVVHDKWGQKELADELVKNPDMYKLRRCRNDWVAQK